MLVLLFILGSLFGFESGAFGPTFGAGGHGTPVAAEVEMGGFGSGCDSFRSLDQLSKVFTLEPRLCQILSKDLLDNSESHSYKHLVNFCGTCKRSDELAYAMRYAKRF